MPQKLTLKTNFLIAALIALVLSSCAMVNTNEQDMKYSPCRNNETEKKVYQQEAAYHNANVTVDCVTASLLPVSFLNVADTQPLVSDGF